MSSKPAKEKLVDDDEEVLQAVILTDSFNKRFRPLTTRKPRCLLPICNAPLLDWTFESLALAGVQEVFVICRSHAELVKEAISESKWSKPGSGMKIVPIMTAKETFSPGDAMRDIYTRGLVTSDFVLVMGDLVSNIRIDEVVRVHKERRRTNKDAIMTMVVKESGIQHRTRAQGESSIFVLDPETSECLHYEHVLGYPRQKWVNIPREILAAHPEIEIRNDLLDCSIYICAVEVPSLFQDNFDYLDIRRDFVHGILTSDLLMKSIHCYVAEEGYAARVQDTRSYESISKDILSRWTFPLVPDDNHPGGHIYEHTRGNRYIAKDNTVVLARTANIGTNTLIGSSTKVSENSSISASVIGQNCTIGPGTTITNSYIFEGAVIGANCVIERSIIGAGARVKDGSVVPKGCMLADGVVVGPNAKLEEFERLSMKRNQVDVEADEEDDDSDIEEVEAKQDSIDKTGLGKDSNAIVWPRGPPDEEDDEEGPENWKNQRFMRLGDSVEYSDAETSSSEDDDSDSDSDDLHDRESISGLSDASTALDGMPTQSSSGLMEDSEFRTEVTQSLERAFAEEHSVDNAAVELKTLRMASNVPLSRVKEAVVSAIVEKIVVVEGDAAAQRKEIASVIGRWGDLINRIGGVDPVETVSILQAHSASSTRMPLFGQILAALYQEDIVEEDDIRKWHALPESQGEDDDRKPGVETDNFKKCWVIGSHMIQQFDAQDSDEESDEEEDEKAKPKAATSDDESDEEEVAAKSAPAAAKAPPTSDSDSSSDEGTPPATFKPPPTVIPAAPAPAAQDTDDSDEEAEKTKSLATPKPASFIPKALATALAKEAETDDSEEESAAKNATAAAPAATEKAAEPRKDILLSASESESEVDVLSKSIIQPSTSTAAPPPPVEPKKDILLSASESESEADSKAAAEPPAAKEAVPSASEESESDAVAAKSVPKPAAAAPSAPAVSTSEESDSDADAAAELSKTLILPAAPTADSKPTSASATSTSTSTPKPEADSTGTSGTSSSEAEPGVPETPIAANTGSSSFFGGSAGGSSSGGRPRSETATATRPRPMSISIASAEVTKAFAKAAKSAAVATPGPPKKNPPPGVGLSEDSSDVDGDGDGATSDSTEGADGGASEDPEGDDSSAGPSGENTEDEDDSDF